MMQSKGVSMAPGAATPADARRAQSTGLIKALAFLMFMMFAMTTDSVGVIIPQIIKTFRSGMAQAGSFQYATMSGIALAGLGLGFLADRIGRKATIILGLALFSANALLFSISESFAAFLILLFVSGAAIGVFKTGALALIGDISTSTAAHTASLNALEGFFGIGAIIGPAIVSRLLLGGASWKWLYVIAGALCAVLAAVALVVRYPERVKSEVSPVSPRQTLSMLRSPYALAFSAGAMLYVGVETAIYVWMPTLLAGYRGPAVWVAAYALSIFFILRAAGRFLGAWMLARLPWTMVLALCSLAILGCFGGALAGGRGAAVYLLPLSGLFMSVIYPTLNSKGISCFAKASHGAIAGIILFFTCVSAVASPLAMGAISDAMGDPRWGFALATGIAALLAVGLAANWLLDPAKARLRVLDVSEY
jgi:fucose permease